MIRKFYSLESGYDFSGATVESIQAAQAQTAKEPTETVTPPAPEAPIVDTPVETVPPVEVAPVAAQVEQPIQTAPPPAEQKEVAPPVVQKSWRDLLKDDGYDDSFVGLADYYKKNNGNIKPYLDALSVDFKSMSAEDIMKRDIQEQYPTVDPDTLAHIYSKQVTEKYNLDSDLSPSEQDTKAGRAMLQNDAEKIRQRFIEKQSQFLIPEKDFAAEAARQQEEQIRQAKEQQEQFRQSLVSSPVTQALTANKSLSLDIGDGAKFNYAVEPNEVMDMLLVPEKYQAAITKKDSSGNVVPDIEALTLQAAFASNPKGFMKALITHGENLGRQKFVDKGLENVETGTVTPVVAIESLEDAFRNRGVKSWQR